MPPYKTSRKEIVSIHALLAECDQTPILLPFTQTGFNPRTPCGVRRVYLITPSCLSSFNPRTPCGVRQRRDYSASSEMLFQSTHSLRSATLTPAECETYEAGFNPRTPCGVRLELIAALAEATGFNPRTPCGVRQPDCDFAFYILCVSIHALLAECDASHSQFFPLPIVSIHALLAECDPVRCKPIPGGCCFNPRTPCGVRHIRRASDSSGGCFNPRTPCGVRPIAPPESGLFHVVSIHALLAECDSHVVDT